MGDILVGELIVGVIVIVGASFNALATGMVCLNKKGERIKIETKINNTITVFEIIIFLINTLHFQ